MPGSKRPVLPAAKLSLGRAGRVAVAAGEPGPEHPARATAMARELEHTQVSRMASRDRKSTRLNSSHSQISYAVFCLKKKKNKTQSCGSCPTSIEPVPNHLPLDLIFNPLLICVLDEPIDTLCFTPLRKCCDPVTVSNS